MKYMRILFLQMKYPIGDKFLAGGEIFTHRTVKSLMYSGHECAVYVLRSDEFIPKVHPTKWEFDGVEINMVNYSNEIPVSKFDALFVGLDSTNVGITLGQINHVPTFQIAHGCTVYPVIEYLSRTSLPVNVVYNSKFVADGLRYRAPSMIMHCPFDPNDFLVEDKVDPYDRPFITLINNIPSKGIMQFLRLAELVPFRRFLVIRGGYYHDRQINETKLRNVEFMDPQTDMRKVYARTRILMYLSDVESWGMAASEAQANGIPVIASHTKDTMGLAENLRSSGLYIDSRDDYIGMIDHINRLDDRLAYQKASLRAMDNAWDRQSDTSELEEFIKARILSRKLAIDLKAI